MGDITKNLSREEVACRCGCGWDTFDYKIATAFQLICDAVSDELKTKCIAIIHSGCRCENHNQKIGGNPRSFHVKGKAIDFHIKYYAIDDLYAMARKVLPMKDYDIVKYDTFIHVEYDPE